LILAYTPNIHLIGSNNFDGSHIFKNIYNFKQISKINDIDNDIIKIDEIVSDKTTNVLPLEIHNKKNLKNRNDLLFISAKS
jgi:hypothetical protein